MLAKPFLAMLTAAVVAPAIGVGLFVLAQGF